MNEIDQQILELFWEKRFTSAALAVLRATELPAAAGEISDRAVEVAQAIIYGSAV